GGDHRDDVAVERGEADPERCRRLLAMSIERLTRNDGRTVYVVRWYDSARGGARRKRTFDRPGRTARARGRAATSWLRVAHPSLHVGRGGAAGRRSILVALLRLHPHDQHIRHRHPPSQSLTGSRARRGRGSLLLLASGGAG